MQSPIPCLPSHQQHGMQAHLIAVDARSAVFAQSQMPQPEPLSVGQWTQSQLLSPETLPSMVAVGARGREPQDTTPTGDGAYLEASEWTRRQQSRAGLAPWYLSLLSKTLLSAPPTFKIAGGGTCLSQSAARQNKGFILCCPGNQLSFLDPSTVHVVQRMTGRAEFREDESHLAETKSQGW